MEANGRQQREGLSDFDVSRRGRATVEIARRRKRNYEVAYIPAEKSISLRLLGSDYFVSPCRRHVDNNGVCAVCATSRRKVVVVS